MTPDDEVRETCAAWIDAIGALDFPRMQALWDEGYDHLVYQPEEFADPMRSWPAILAYWKNVPNVVDSVPEWREIEGDVAVIGDAALVYSRLMTRIQIKDVAPTFDGELRCTLGLRRTPSGWRLIHYHESRLVEVEAVIADLTGRRA